MDGEAFVAALIKMSDADGAVGHVVTLSVSEGDPAHIVRQIAIGAGPKQQMPVVTHDAIAAEPYINPFETFGEDGFKSLEIAWFAKYPQPAIGAIENVVSVTA